MIPNSIFADSSIDIPISCPMVSLIPGSWLIVSSIQLLDGEQLTLENLSLHIRSMEDYTDSNTSISSTSTQNNPISIIPQTLTGGIAYSSLLIVNSIDTYPLLQSNFYTLTAPVDFTTYATMPIPYTALKNEAISVTASTSGLYSISVANNTTNKAITLNLSGSINIAKI